MSRPAILPLLLALAGGSAVAAEPLADRLDVLARPESARALAAYARNLYDELIARGFGHVEAVQLVAAFAPLGTGGEECRSAR